MSNRDRAWRRAMRRKHIHSRRESLPEKTPKPPVRLWQLHRGEQALNILHRESAGPYGFLCPPEDVQVREGPYCLIPTWGGRGRVLVKAGMVWKCIREYTPDFRPTFEGVLSKTPQATKQKLHGKDKRWKMTYTRDNKVYRARKLGFEYRPHWKGLTDP